MKIDYITHAGEILMLFPEPLKCLPFTPAQARENAALLNRLADEIEPAREQVTQAKG